MLWKTKCLALKKDDSISNLFLSKQRYVMDHGTIHVAPGDVFIVHIVHHPGDRQCRRRIDGQNLGVGLGTGHKPQRQLIWDI